MAEANQSKKKNPFGKMVKYFKDTKSELKKVVWPSKQQVINNTIVVVSSIIIIGAFLFLWDLLASQGFSFLAGLGGK